MKKINWLPVAKVGGFMLGIFSTALASWATSKDNEKTLQKLVDERLKK